MTSLITVAPVASAAAGGSAPARWSAAGKLALQLWVSSILGCWVLGLQFSQLWWLVNARQLRWILFCYLWEVPIIGWTGAVMVPYLGLRHLLRRAAVGDPGVSRDLARYPAGVAACVLATTVLGYLLGAAQVNHFADLPPLEFAKITLQGPILGGLFAVAAYLLAERTIDSVQLPPTPGAPPMVQSLYVKVFSITLALTLGVSISIFLYGLSQSQRQREELLARAMTQVLDRVTTPWELEEALASFGPHTSGFVARRSNNQIVWGKGAGTVLLGDGHRDFEPIQKSERGWFASRDAEHKVVAYQHRPGLLADGDGAVLVAVSPIQDYGSELVGAMRAAGMVLVCALGIGLVLAAMLARSIVRPVERLHAAATQMAAGNLEVAPVAIARGDEVAALARTFDRMADRVRTDERNLRHAYEQLQQAQSQLVQHERLSAVGRVVSGVAHELNNPLAAVLHLAEELRAEGGRSGADQEALEIIADQARRCRTIVRDLLSFVRGREQQAAPAEAASVVARARAAAEPVLRQTGATLAVELDPGLPTIVVDAAAIEQVLTNLIANGAQAAGPTGLVRLAASPESGGWRFQVEDSGPGIPAEILPRIYEPFFTTKPQGQGTGLGLAVSLGIVERHGGTLDVDPGGNGSGRGARFAIWIPPAGLATATRRAVAPPSRHQTGQPRALVIDDERSIRVALARYLRRQGWEVDEADDGEAALRILSGEAGDGYGLVISDVRMPRRSGMDVHDWLTEHRPEIFQRLIIATGDVASPQVRSFLGRTTRPVIEKPFELGALGELVEQIRQASG